ncbi:MAG TPA: biopolymer transporter ExbD, partial [Polyangiaceae bacterium]
MAGINVGGGSEGRRALNRELPLVPFIDFLLCLVAFLLVTAVWSQMARLNADARVPGPSDASDPLNAKTERELHVEMRGDRKFQLIWKEGAVVVNTVDVDRQQVKLGNTADYRYPALAKQIANEWQNNGSHRAASDRQFDRAVLHTDNATPFSDIIAVIDAVYEPQREVTIGASVTKTPAFNLTFAVN